MNQDSQPRETWKNRILNFFEPPGTSYSITRDLFLRALGFIYFAAFLCLNRQVLALIGHEGLLPADLYFHQFREYLQGSNWDGFLRMPAIFWFGDSDILLTLLSWFGLGLSVLVMAGVTNALLMAFLWFLYMSYVHIGQLFYGYGWETMTLEAGFLAIFLCPIRTWRSHPPHYPTPLCVLWFYRWMLFRVMFGAGLIKLRGDPCWHELTCLIYHYETQPLPNPLSWYLHQLPLWFHQGGVLFNHFVEIIVPWFYFAPRRWRHLAGWFTVAFQIILVLSGNLSFLNWLTIVIAIPCFDDGALRYLGRPRTLVTAAPALSRRVVLTILSIMLIYLSKNPILNMISSRQVMNTSFDRLHLMNTYGAFGGIGKERYEIIIEGTNDMTPDDSSEWRAYEFLAKPGDVMRRPPVIAPYQSRIDWQIWFAAMSDYQRNPWLVHFVYKLLKGDERALRLLRNNPFPAGPPRFIRCRFYRYQFTTPAERKQSGAWWKREYAGVYLPPLFLDNPSLRDFLKIHGWLYAE